MRESSTGASKFSKMMRGTRLNRSANVLDEGASVENTVSCVTHRTKDPHDLVRFLRSTLELPITKPSESTAYSRGLDRWISPSRRSSATVASRCGGVSQQRTEAADVIVRVARGSVLVDLNAERHREWSPRHSRLVLKVCKALFSRQLPFLSHGLKRLRPMTQSDVAGDTGLHYSTVGRCVGDLMAKTPQGQVRVRDLFTARIGTETGGAISSRAVQEQLRQVVATEDPAAPLSDEGICSVLRARGICVKRRTVSKYRQKLGIPNKGARWANMRPAPS